MAGERRWYDQAPETAAFAEIVCPAEPSLAETNPAVVPWRNFRVDPDLVGVRPAGPRPTRNELRGAPDQPPWLLPVTDPLPVRLAWHPTRPLVAGLFSRARRAHPWVADCGLRTVRIFAHVPAALSCVTASPPLAWIDEERLALLTPGPVRPADEPEHDRPVVVEARGPAHVDFQPGIGELTAVASAHVSVLDLTVGVLTRLTGPLLVRRLARRGDSLYVEHVDEISTSEGVLSWRSATVGPDAAEELHPAEPEPPATGGSDRCFALTEPAEPAGHSTEIPTGHHRARLTAFPGRDATVLWLRDARPGEYSGRPGLDGGGYRVANLDLPLHWPPDVTVESLRAQITTAVGLALGELDGPVTVAGHSFGATLALYALAHFPEIRAAIAHSGCYNRTLTPTGFHHEKRTYWTAPEIYREFGALDFADRLNRPVLLVHGAEDRNPATAPEHSVELYRAIVATGGHARLVLLPHEDHTFVHRENRELLAEEQRAWIERWSR